MTKEKLALYGIIGAAIISLIGVFITSTTQTKIEWIPVTQTAQSISMTEKANLPSPHLIISDSFENNHNNWILGENDSVKDSMVDGNFQKTLITDHADHTDSWTTEEIPGVLEKNFCLIFDVQLIQASDNAEVVIILRGVNYEDTENRNYIRIRLLDSGLGSIWAKVNNGAEQRISEFEGIFLGDNKPHKIQISVQENVIEILESDTDKLPQRITIENDKLILATGVIRFGLGIHNPNQKATMAFDNLFLYSKCP